MKFSKAAIVVGATLLCGIVLSACGSGGGNSSKSSEIFYGHPQLDQMGRKSKRRLTNTMRRIRISK